MKIPDIYYNQGYIYQKSNTPYDGEKIMTINKLRNEIQAKMNEHMVYLEKYGGVGNRPLVIAYTEGWVEALEYVLGRMDAQGEEE